jgi:hypothetical protein
MRQAARHFQDLGYCDCSHMLKQLEEVSKLLDAYNRTIQKSKAE